MSHLVKCAISGEEFFVSDHEMRLRGMLDIMDTPTVLPKYRFQHLWAFWPHWTLHKRECNKTEKQIISVFSDKCPYPVWHKDQWFAHASPPKVEIDFDKLFFDQAWSLFQNCPIPHVFQNKNEQCEYTDDWYESRDCYLCHSGEKNEGTRYGYGLTSCKDCLYCVFSQFSQWCIDCVNVSHSYECYYCLDVRDSNSCWFSYNLRNCSDCLFCFNLRNKRYCVGNKQFTPEQYDSFVQEWWFDTIAGYQKWREKFVQMMHDIAWIKADYIELSENTTWNYLAHCKDAENSYMTTYHEDCCHDFWSGPGVKFTCEWVGTIGCQMGYMVTMPINCYQIRWSFMNLDCRFSDYIAYCAQGEELFGCCGLVRGHHCILNAPYSAQEYTALKEKLRNHMIQTGEWWRFFPGHFAPNPYDESISGYHWSLSPWEQERRGFRVTSDNFDKNTSSYTPLVEIPKTPFDATQDIVDKIFYDEKKQTPFQILALDVNFCRKLWVALTDRHYMRRIQENFSWMPFSGELRVTTCVKSGKKITTSWPSHYDKRIISEEEYLKLNS